MAEELKDALDIDLEMIEGSGGVFDVVADNELVYSKARTGQFPEPGEVTKILQSIGPHK